MTRMTNSMRHWPMLASVAVLVSALSGCGLFSDEEILEGERIRLRTEPVVAEVEGGAAPLPPAQTNSDWTQTNGIATHNLGHLCGPVSLSRVWTADAGRGTSDDSAITSAPIVVGGTIFTLDAEAMLSAFAAGSGARAWRVSLTPEGEDGDEGFGGGLASDGNVIYAATGFGEILAISPRSGEILWRESFGAPFRSAPAAEAGLVVAVTRDNRAIGVDAATGKVRWRLPAASIDAGFLGGASPAISGRLVILPYASGALLGVDGASGRRRWSAVMTGGRRGLARAAITEVSGDPVIVGPYVVAANQSGRILAIDGRNGRRVWTRNFGSAGPIWAAGETVFVVTDDAQVMRVSARDGKTLWSVQLPEFKDAKDREDAIAYSGPVLVSGKILVTDSRGNLRSFDALTGAEGVSVKVDGGSMTGPVVANGTVYVLSDNGTLAAYR